MKITLFDLEPWEQSFLKEHFQQDELQMFEESLTMDNLNKAEDAEVLGVFIYSHVSAEMIEQLKKLKHVITYSTGFDHIDMEVCKDRGISVSNVPTYGENTVAEHTFALILNLTRKVHRAYDNMLHGNYSLDGLRGIDLKGRTLGIVGLGHIGEHVARIAQGFEMNIVVHDPVREKDADRPDGGISYTSFEDLLKRSDIISFHCPLLEGTTHMLNKETVKLCKKGVYIINTARGPIIETDALVNALDSGQVAGAGLDVLEEEQCFLKGEEKEILSKKFDQQCMTTLLENHMLLKDPRVIITPHNAFNSQEALERIYKTTAENISACQKGSPINVVSE